MNKIINEQLNIGRSTPVKARNYHYKKFTYPLHFHDEFELMYVKKGFGKCIIGDAVSLFSEKTLFLFGPGLPHCMKNDIRYDLDNNLNVNGTIIQFEKNFMQYSFTNYLPLINICNMLKNSSRGIRFTVPEGSDIENIFNSITKADSVNKIIRLLELLNMLSQIKNKKIIASPICNTSHTALNDKKIQKIINFIHQNYTHKISLESIAAYTAMNACAFCRYFKENTGKTLTQYIIEIRIGQACKLLRTGKLNISQISLECGFDTISHFNRCFKKITGYTPKSYRKITE